MNNEFSIAGGSTYLRDDARRGGGALDGGGEADGAVAALPPEAHLVVLVREVIRCDGTLEALTDDMDTKSCRVFF